MELKYTHYPPSFEHYFGEESAAIEWMKAENIEWMKAENIVFGAHWEIPGQGENAAPVKGKYQIAIERFESAKVQEIFGWKLKDLNVGDKDQTGKTFGPALRYLVSPNVLDGAKIDGRVFNTTNPDAQRSFIPSRKSNNAFNKGNPAMLAALIGEMDDVILLSDPKIQFEVGDDTYTNPMEFGYGVNDGDAKGNTWFHYLAVVGCYNDFDEVNPTNDFEQALRIGADPFAKNKAGEIPAMVAVRAGNTQFLHRFLDHTKGTGNLNSLTDTSENLYLYIAEHGTEEVIKAFMTPVGANAPDPRTRKFGKTNETMLMVAARSGNVVKTETNDKKGETEIYAVDVLLSDPFISDAQKAAMVATRNKAGYNVFEIAAMSENANLDIVRVLLETNQRACDFDDLNDLVQEGLVPSPLIQRLVEFRYTQVVLFKLNYDEHAKNAKEAGFDPLTLFTDAFNHHPEPKIAEDITAALCENRVPEYLSAPVVTVTNSLPDQIQNFLLKLMNKNIAERFLGRLKDISEDSCHDGIAYCFRFLDSIDLSLHSILEEMEDLYILCSDDVESEKLLCHANHIRLVQNW